ncbi:MAG: 23S rRNA (uracil(1939)-C(5))-methyltransferase RlmD [Clostridiales bacterium]|nr:23S rRNA (uracil(1939)-C(5))-methyltransferase RlmD [Candidatus Apopatocola equi]
MTKNEEFSAPVDAYGSEGEGVCRYENRAVFVAGALPGEQWRVRITRVQGNAVWGRGMELLSPPHPHRTASDCPAFPRCGGCALRHMDYEEELRFKLNKVNENLRRIGGTDFRVSGIVGADADAFERCKAIFNVGTDADGRITAGFYRPRSHEIVSAPDCALVRSEARRAARATVAWMEAHRLRAYDEKQGVAGVRHVFVRSSRLSGQCVVTLITSSPLSAALRESYVDSLRTAVPELSGVVLCLNRQKGNVVLQGSMETLWGSELLTEALCGLKFELSPRSFFQVNPPQAQRLYELAVGYTLAEGGGLVLDLYCGTGTIGLCMARGAERVIGVEVIADAVKNARENAERNGIENAEFLCADAAEAAAELQRRGTAPDAVVVDPPRKGLAPSVIDSIAAMNPRRVVYVSCDSATLARDIALFRAKGYLPREASAVDMFPRTSHVETVVLLSKGEISSRRVRVDFSLENLDTTFLRGEATYEQIKAHVLEQTGLKVSTLYISQIKRKYGLEVGESYNKPKSEDARQPQCPPEKEKAITDALKHFGVI